MWRRASARGLVRAFVLGWVLAVVAAGLSGAAREVAPGVVPVGVAPDVGSALLAARVQGSPVEVADLRTPTRTVVAEPGGTFTAELSAVPTRVRRGGVWVPVETAIGARGDGTVGPRAAVGELALSGGGAKAPLARLVKDGRSFALYWPGELPVPRVVGNAATYVDVLPGVDLTMYAESNGYRQQLVIKTAEAARNPGLERIRFRVETAGLRLEVAKSGVVTAVDEAGEPVFVAPPSVMWDSSGGSAQVGVEVRDGSLILSPDRAFLADPAVVFPVVVDPDMRTWDKSNWATVLSGKSTQSYWWTSGAGSDVAQIGQCNNSRGDCNGIGAARAYFQFDTSWLNGRRILGAEIKSTVVHSPDCGSHAHQVFRTDGQIHPGTTWDNAPAGVTWTNYTAPPRPGCANHGPVGAGTINTGGVTTYFFKADNEGDQLAWRKFNPGETKLSVRFNTGPFQPTELSTDPPVPAPCRWCDGTPYIGDEFIRLRARLSDPDGDQVKPLWILTVNGVEEGRWGFLQASGAMHDTTVDLRNRHDQRIRWQVQTWDTDNGNNLDASTWAHSPGSFVVDREPPNAKPTVKGVLYQDDNRWHGGTEVPDTFTFGPNGVGDIDHYLWGWSYPPTNRVDAVGRLSGDATVTEKPPGDGPRTLYVRSVDRAGHESETYEHRFYVRAGNGPLAHWALDGNVNDSAFLGDRHGSPAGAVTYTPGAAGAAIQLSSNARVTAPYAVRADASFSVAAWVKADRLVTGTHMTAVSQSGSFNSGFELQYNSGHQRWIFIMKSGDTENATQDAAVSSQQPVVGQWTHIAGVYDSAARQLRIYVNGQLTGSRTWTSTWDIAGPVAIGYGLWRGGPGKHWPGAIDEVQIFDRVTSDAELRAMVSRDDVTAGSWRFDDERLVGGQPNTVARNAVDGGLTGELRDGATFADGAVNGAVQLDGVDDHVATSGPVLRTDQSFSVAAWVKADRLVTGTHMSAVTQVGTVNHGFSLQYNGGHRKWLFIMSSDDTETAVWDAAVAQQPAHQPVTGQWVHLAGVYDAAARQLRIYVNGQFGGSRPWTAGWNPTGPLLIGRGMWRGAPSERWPGAIDEVRVYSRAVAETELQTIVSRANVTAGKWKLDGNAGDSSGRNLHGTPVGGPQWTAGQGDYPDPADSAVTLDGTDDHIRAAPALNTGTSFSVAAWAKLSAKRSGWGTVASQNGEHTAAFNLAYAGNVDRWGFAMHGPDSDSPTSVVRVLAPQAVQTGVWTHLAAVFDATSGEMRLYVNGVLAATGRFTTTWNAGVEFDIGRAKWVSNWIDYFPGSIDDVVAYNRPLFSDEIRALAGRDLSLVHHWRLDETTGTAGDSVGARGATPTGGATFGPGRVGNAVRLDGIDDAVSTTGVDLRTDKSFTVSAWVFVNGTTDTTTAVSVDGDHTSKFRLGRFVDSDQAPRGKWVFEMPEEDIDDAQATEAALSVEPSELSTWVHLVGVYDAEARRIWLYVNGSRIDDGVLNNPWPASGGLWIGRGKVAGDAAQFWPGSVDDVRVYTGILDKDRIWELYRSYPPQN